MGAEYVPVWLGVLALAGTIFSGIMAFLSRGKASEALEQSKQNHTDGEVNAEKADQKAAEISKKADQIHELTNSRLSEMDKKLAISVETISGMEKLISKLEQQLALLAAAKSSPEEAIRVEVTKLPDPPVDKRK